MNASPSDFCCFHCGTPYEFKERIGRSDSCPKCDSDLHCCRNCRHYSPNAHNQCSETQADWVKEKDRANYCDYFDPRRRAVGGSVTGRVQDARARFEGLFKK
jgi:hypothetical protein